MQFNTAQRRRSWQTIPPIALYAAELRQAAFSVTDIRLYPLHGPNQTIDGIGSERFAAPFQCANVGHDKRRIDYVYGSLRNPKLHI